MTTYMSQVTNEIKCKKGQQMAKAKMNFKTPLLPLSWVTISGQGKVKYQKEDNGDYKNYEYTATVTIPDEEAMKPIKAKLDKFWRENKPQGATKQKYAIIHEEMIPTLDADGKIQKDEDDEIIKHHSGKYTMQAKTCTRWDESRANVIKMLGSNGQPLQEGHKLVDGCGIDTLGIIHGSIGINAFSGNEGLQFYLNAVQIKDSTFTEYAGGDEVDADEIEDDVADTEVEDSADNTPNLG